MGALGIPQHATDVLRNHSRFPVPQLGSRAQGTQVFRIVAHDRMININDR